MKFGAAFEEGLSTTRCRGFSALLPGFVTLHVRFADDAGTTAHIALKLTRATDLNQYPISTVSLFILGSIFAIQTLKLRLGYTYRQF